jgi:hypothetical protein
MATNPYSSGTNAEIVPIPGGAVAESKTLNILTACILPTLNEASLFWGCTEWSFWHFPEMLPYGVKLWALGAVGQIVVSGSLTLMKASVGISRSAAVLIFLPSVAAFFALWAIRSKAIEYVHLVGLAMFLLQFAILVTNRASMAARASLAIACISGVGLFLFHMMVYSLQT